MGTSYSLAGASGGTGDPRSLSPETQTAEHEIAHHTNLQTEKYVDKGKVYWMGGLDGSQKLWTRPDQLTGHLQRNL